MKKSRYNTISLTFISLVLLLLHITSLADEPAPFSLDITSIYYTDELGRWIDYDFSEGQIDPNGKIALPVGAYGGFDPDAVLFLEPAGDIVNSEFTDGALTMSVAPADFHIEPILSADIIVDGDASDWSSIESLVLDTDTYEDDVSVAGSDVEYVKLAYSEDGTQLHILIKVADTVNPILWYQALFDRDADENVSKNGNYQVDFYYDPISGWILYIYEWNKKIYDWDLLEVPAQAASSGPFLEGSFDIADLEFPDRFYFSGATLSQDDEDEFEQLDSFAAPKRSPGESYILTGYNVEPQISETWEFLISVENFQNVGREEFWHYLNLAMNDPNSHQNLGWIYVSWFTGEFGRYVQNRLGISALLENKINDFEHKGYTPQDVSLDLKMEVQKIRNSRFIIASYRLNQELWRKILKQKIKRKLSSEHMLGLFQIQPRLWWWTRLNHLPDLISRIDLGDQPETLIPGIKIKVPVTITNIGNEKAQGKIAVNIFSSADQVLDEEDALWIQKKLKLKLPPGRQKIYYIALTVPVDIPAGSYYLIAEIDVDDNVYELDESDYSNQAITSEPIIIPPPG